MASDSSEYMELDQNNASTNASGDMDGGPPVRRRTAFPNWRPARQPIVKERLTHGASHRDRRFGAAKNDGFRRCNGAKGCAPQPRRPSLDAGAGPGGGWARGGSGRLHAVATAIPGGGRCALAADYGRR